MNKLDFTPTLQAIQNPLVRLDFIMEVSNLLESRPTELASFFYVSFVFHSCNFCLSRTDDSSFFS